MPPKHKYAYTTTEQRQCAFDFYCAALTPKQQAELMRHGPGRLPPSVHHAAERAAAVKLTTRHPVLLKNTMASNPRAKVVPKVNVLRFIRKWVSSIAKDPVNGHNDKHRMGRHCKVEVPTERLVKVGQGSG